MFLSSFISKYSHWNLSKNIPLPSITKTNYKKKLVFYSDKFTFPISNFFKKLRIRRAPYNRHNLSSILVNNKIDKIDPINRSGVYMLEAIYIGQTGRSFKIRYSEHIKSLRQLQLSNTPFDFTSSFADHLINDNHSPSLNNPQPLHFAPKGPKLFIRVGRNKESHFQKPNNSKLPTRH